ncbi:MAG: SDR family oxidoreductase [Burkholderiales bacterium]
MATWLVTGGAGFIGSHLVESLLMQGEQVRTLDNLSTGHASNLEDVRRRVGESAWARHNFIHADILDLDACRRACNGAQFVLHQAALGSVPRSIADPIASNAANVSGFLNLLVAAKDAGIRRVVYASSSSVYGDHPALPKVEDQTGQPLSPYAVTKVVNELYAGVFSKVYGMEVIGLRYFNVFGARQDPEGPYAAVIPRWVKSLLRDEEVRIHGDGETTRDFCYVKNVVQANLKAATTDSLDADRRVLNVAVNQRVSLNVLFGTLVELLSCTHPVVRSRHPVFVEFRQGDVRHSLADISRAREVIGYSPTHDLRAGLEEALPWYVSQFERSSSPVTRC